jgi:hypothetical protein
MTGSVQIPRQFYIPYIRLIINWFTNSKIISNIQDGNWVPDGYPPVSGMCPYKYSRSREHGLVNGLA